MKISYDIKEDTTRLTFKKAVVAETKKIKDWLLIDYSAKGDMLAVTILKTRKNSANAVAYLAKLKKKIPTKSKALLKLLGLKK